MAEGGIHSNMSVQAVRNRLGKPLNQYFNTSTREVKETLRDFALRRSWAYRTVSRLGNIFPTKFESYVRLLDKLNGMAEQDGIIKCIEDEKGNKHWEGTFLKVISPNMAALNSINVDKIMENPKAWQEVVRVVYLPEKNMIDLRELVWINKRFCR